MSDKTESINNSETWSRYAKQYDPLKIGSIDGTDLEPHDKGIVRATYSNYYPNRHVKGLPECTIFVSRLSSKTTKDTIKEVFSKFGRLRRFRLVKDIVTGFPKGYAFIEYESETSAEEAYRRANRMNLDGHVIFVDFECERLLKDWKPRRLGGGFGGNKESGQLRFGGRDRPFRKPVSLEIKERDAMLREREQQEREYREQRSSRSNKRDKETRESEQHTRKISSEKSAKKEGELKDDRKAAQEEKRLEERHENEANKEPIVTENYVGNS